MFLTRDRATEFIKEEGIPATDRTLADMASRGGGPRYCVINGRCLYRPSDLKAWLNQAAEQEPRKRRA